MNFPEPIEKLVADLNSFNASGHAINIFTYGDEYYPVTGEYIDRTEKTFSGKIKEFIPYKLSYNSSYLHEFGRSDVKDILKANQSAEGYGIAGITDEGETVLISDLAYDEPYFAIDSSSGWFFNISRGLHGPCEYGIRLEKIPNEGEVYGVATLKEDSLSKVTMDGQEVSDTATFVYNPL